MPDNALAPRWGDGLDGLRSRGVGLQEPRVGPRRQRGDETASATLLGPRRHGACTFALAWSSRAPRTAASGEGGRMLTETRPPPDFTRIPARDQPGTDARAAATASPPLATASAPASAAEPASVAEY